jgi:hypothetical protein
LHQAGAKLEEVWDDFKLGMIVNVMQIVVLGSRKIRIVNQPEK